MKTLIRQRCGSKSRTLIVVVAAVIYLGGVVRVPADLVSEWRFGETSGGTAFDNVGNINGSLSEGAVFAPGAGPGPGVYSGAINLSSASSGFVNMGMVYPFTVGNFSIIVWVKTDQAGAPPNYPVGQIVLSKHNTGYANGYFFALNDVFDGLTTVGSHFYAASSFVGSTQNATDGVWRQFAVVYQQGIGMNYYINGLQQGSALGNFIVDNNAPFLVGGVNYFGTLAGTYTGLISDVRVYNEALLGPDVFAAYEQVLNGQPVPEPSTLGLLSLSLLALARRSSLRGRSRSDGLSPGR